MRRCCYNMAEVTDEVEGSDLDADAETEVPAVVESESTPCQSEGKESEKVRLPYSCTSSSSPSIPHPRPLSCPYLAQNPSLVCTYSFKVPLPIYFHPLPQNQCLSGLTLFSYQGRKILKKVKSALQQNAEKRKRKTSTILVWYYRQGKRKNENKPETDQESLSPTSSNSYQGSEILK